MHDRNVVVFIYGRLVKMILPVNRESVLIPVANLVDRRAFIPSFPPYPAPYDSSCHPPILISTRDRLRVRYSLKAAVSTEYNEKNGFDSRLAPRLFEHRIKLYPPHKLSVI